MFKYCSISIGHLFLIIVSMFSSITIHFTDYFICCFIKCFTTIVYVIIDY